MRARAPAKPAQLPRPIRALSAAPRPAVRALSPAPRPQPGPGPGFRPCALSRLGCGAGPVARGRPSPSDGCPRASRDQNPSDRRGALDLASFGFALSLSSPLTALSSPLSPAAADTERGASTARELSKPRRRLRPPRRRARSPVGERAAVERPGRGALVAVPASRSPPAGPFFSPRSGVHDGEVSRAEPPSSFSFPFLFL